MLVHVFEQPPKTDTIPRVSVFAFFLFVFFRKGGGGGLGLHRLRMVPGRGCAFDIQIVGVPNPDLRKPEECLTVRSGSTMLTYSLLQATVRFVQAAELDRGRHEI